MSIDLEQACGILEEFLEDTSRTRKVKESIEVAIDSGQVEPLQLVTDVLAWMPSADHLASLRRVVDSGEADELARVEAVRGIATILDAASSRLTQQDAGQEPLLSQEQIDDEIKYLMGVYANSSHPTLLRQKTLENAASLATTPAIHEAGKTALASPDPSWVASGIYVIRQCDPHGALKVLEQHLKHESVAVRLEAIQGYAQIGHKAQYKKLADLIYNSTGDAQMVLLAALADVSRKKAGDLLWEAAEWMDGEAGVHANAAYRRWVETAADSAPDELEEPGEPEPVEEEAPLADEVGTDVKSRIAAATEEGAWVDTEDHEILVPEIDD